MRTTTNSLAPWKVASLAVGAAVAVSCAGDSADEGTRGDRNVSAQALVSGFPELHVFMGDYLEVDHVADETCDANYHVGADPADGSLSAQSPTCEGGDCNFVDWNSLCEADLDAHRYSDEVGADSTAFPGSNHCVGPARVLSKMDLTYVMAANNSEYAYFAVQRRNNNGDAAYYWLLTRQAPSLVADDPVCKGDDEGLWYNIEGSEDGPSDVMLIGHFHPSGTCSLRVFYAAENAYVNAVDAVNYESSLWTEVVDAETLSAVNATMTAAGACGAETVDDQALVAPGVIEPELFAEAAVPLSVLTGGEVCGASFFASVITRPSASGGTSPDMKDIVGPLYLDFGSVSATAELTARCDRAIDYALTSVTGIAGGAIDPDDDSVSCEWTFTNGDAELAASGSCSGTLAIPDDAPTGTWTGTVDVSVAVGSTTCGAEAAAGDADAWDEITVDATATAYCDETFSYSATAGGGSGDYGYAWEFSGPGSTTPDSSTDASGSVAVGTTGDGLVYTAAVVVTDLREDLEGCTASDSADANPLSPITVSLDLAPGARTCPDITSDALTWNANVGGGDGDYVYDWTVDACDGHDYCTIDPSDSDFCPSGSVALSVDDDGGEGLPACDGADSETETWSKVTTVTASDN